jgi:hypothetical protein
VAVAPDEGHGLAKPENRLHFYSKVESFLGKHLGGRVIPVDKKVWRGTSAVLQ